MEAGSCGVGPQVLEHGVNYIRMEYVEGKSISDSWPYGGNQQSLAGYWKLLTTVGVAQVDFKGGNAIIRENGKGVCLIDYGFALDAPQGSKIELVYQMSLACSKMWYSLTKGILFQQKLSKQKLTGYRALPAAEKTKASLEIKKQMKQWLKKQKIIRNEDPFPIGAPYLDYK